MRKKIALCGYIVGSYMCDIAMRTKEIIELQDTIKKYPDDKIKIKKRIEKNDLYKWDIKREEINELIMQDYVQKYVYIKNRMDRIIKYNMTYLEKILWEKYLGTDISEIAKVYNPIIISTKYFGKKIDAATHYVHYRNSKNQKHQIDKIVANEIVLKVKYPWMISPIRELNTCTPHEYMEELNIIDKKEMEKYVEYKTVKDNLKLEIYDIGLTLDVYNTYNILIYKNKKYIDINNIAISKILDMIQKNEAIIEPIHDGRTWLEKMISAITPTKKRKYQRGKTITPKITIINSNTTIDNVDDEDNEDNVNNNGNMGQIQYRINLKADERAYDELIKLVASHKPITETDKINQELIRACLEKGYLECELYFLYRMSKHV